MPPRSQWTEEERVWFELFKAALTSAHIDDAVEDAERALDVVKQRIKSKEPEPLFDPLLRKKAAERKQTDEDSSFGVA